MGNLTTQIQGLELKPPDHRDQSREGERDERIEWVLVETKNEEYVLLSACTGALPTSDFEAKEARSNPSSLPTRQIVDPS